ncbi:MAG: SUMF1/EgtB/PvdO family nonheme iron enzyme [Anaerolineae bacterium]|nr:SUMF1/EgtB/PvdO family nonheme iron enzyme [Anaerolineae bacterium]
MVEQPRHIRLFLSSPGDVGDERGRALEVIDALPYDPAFRGKVTIEVIAWDKPGAGTPMLATMTPQEAIDQGLPRPSECDIVIVIFWARMGTPLPHPTYKKPDGTQYLSGTEYEYLDAVNGSEANGSPLVVVYRRTEDVALKPSDPAFMQKYEQWQRVEAFFAAFRNPDGSLKRGINEYSSPDAFRSQFEHDLRALVMRLLNAPAPRKTPLPPTAPPPFWEGSPFPGLHAFTPADAPIFFGRGRETDDLVKRLADGTRFLAVVGASGSGKSSLVGAGLIPRLLDNAIPGSKDWRWVRFTPDELGTGDPFAAFAAALKTLGALDKTLLPRLRDDPTGLGALCQIALDGQPDWAETLFFIDQFEELFTSVHPEHRQAFVALLDQMARTDRVRVLVTMRADFYARCVEWPELNALVNQNTYSLSAPGMLALGEMITRPAARAGLKFEDGLADRILTDTGAKPGALALMGYTLDELYKLCRHGGALSHAAYDTLGGVQGAIGTRAQNTFETLDTDARAALPHVFRNLVEMDERGTATRLRAPLNRVTLNDAAGRLVAAFTEARLLTTSRGPDNTPLLEVAHEALYSSWPALAEWIEETRGDLYLLKELRKAARTWDEHNRDRDYLWLGERGQDAQRMLARLAPPDMNEVERAFARPEHEHLRDELEEVDVTHVRREAIGQRLLELNDPRPGVGLRDDGLPDIAWCYVDVPKELHGKQIEFVDDGGGTFGAFVIEPFYIAKYPVTYAQFQAFVEDDYANPAWWRDMPERYQAQDVEKARQPYTNYPRDSVSWYQAVAFCRWLSHELGYEVTLPTEQHWQWAAQNGLERRDYPWEGGGWDGRRCNTREAGVGRSTAVGMYPHGAAACGALDMSGNLWEWCLNKYENPEMVTVADDSTAGRVLRGGSWSSSQYVARAASRYNFNPFIRDFSYGFRVVRPPSL